MKAQNARACWSELKGRGLMERKKERERERREREKNIKLYDTTN
jgi:hypothetical protein